MAEKLFTLKTEYITLGQLMKAVGLISNGSDAKVILAQGGNKVNGEDENRRGKKLRPGDTVVFKSGTVVKVQ